MQPMRQRFDARHAQSMPLIMLRADYDMRDMRART